MKILIAYDSVFGNTEQIARAIGAGFEGKAEVSVLRVGEVRPTHLSGLDLLLVGSPTRAFRPTPATVQFLKGLARDSLKGVRVTGFDTRADLEEVNSRFLNFMVSLFGYAAQPIARRLVKKGGSLCIPPEGFLVKGTEGPLKDGELERARNWAQKIRVG